MRWAIWRYHFMGPLHRAWHDFNPWRVLFHIGEAARKTATLAAAGGFPSWFAWSLWQLGKPGRPDLNGWVVGGWVFGGTVTILLSIGVAIHIGDWWAVVKRRAGVAP